VDRLTNPSGWRRLAGASARHPALLGLALGLVYAALAESIALVSSFGNSGGVAASFWPAAGVTIAALLAVAPRRWPWLLAGVWAAEVLVDLSNHTPPAVAVTWGLANAVEPVCSALLLRWRIGARPELVRRQHLTAFVGAAVLTGPALGALVGAAATAVAGMDSFGVSWLRWLVGDGIGVLVVAPAIFAVRDRRQTTGGLRWGLLGLAGALSLVSFGPLTILRQDTLAFSVIPALIWLAFRGGEPAAATGVLSVALITNLATAFGWGPFAARDGAFAGLVNAQVFLATTALSAFMVAVLSHDLVRRDEVEARLRHQAVHDTLTGLANRRLVFERLGVVAQGGTGLVAVLMIDLDGFKEVNDRLGHGYGDAVLVETARRLQAATRPLDLVARLGGDEFLVCLERPSSPHEVWATAARLGRVVGAPITVGDSEVSFGASIGSAFADAAAFEADALLRRADENMYAVKDHHRRRSPAMEGREPTEVPPAATPAGELAGELAAALEGGALHLEFQPEVSLRDGSIVGLEALARWDHPRLGPVPPKQFIPLAEANGLLASVGAWALRTACLTVRDRVLAQPARSAVHVAVNVPAVQLADPEFPAVVMEALATAGIRPELLTVEISDHQARPWPVIWPRCCGSRKSASGWRSVVSDQAPPVRRCSPGLRSTASRSTASWPRRY